MLERLPAHVLWIFTTTTEGQTLFEGAEDSHPLLSRCIEFSLAQRGLAEPMAKKAKEIAQSEGLDGQPLSKYKRLVNESKANMRAVLTKIESGEMLS